MDVVSESSVPAVVGPNPDDDVEQTLEKEVERAEKISESLESSLQESFERQRRLKRDLRMAEDRTIRLKEELEETLRTIRDDRRRIMALQAEQSFTAKQIKDALSLDLKQYEATLRSKQPDLYDYCNQATNARDCVVVINSIRLCRRHIQLAEMIIAHRYASYLSEKPSPNAPPPLAHHPLAHPPIGGSVGSGVGGQSPVSVQSSPVCPALNCPSSPLSQLLSPPVNQSTSPVNQSTLPVNQPLTINQLLTTSHQQSAAALQHHPYHQHQHHHQHRIKSEKMKPRRLSLVKVDHKTTPTAATAAAMATVAMATSSTSTSSSSRPAASVSAAKTGGSRDAASGTTAADVVRIEIRERDSHPAWIATRDIKPIVLTYVGK